MQLDLPRKLGYTPALRDAKMLALVFGAYSLLPVLNAHFGWFDSPRLSGGLGAVLSFALALLIGFRINQAYDRWWEARKLWGTLVNVSRNLAAKIHALQRPDSADRELIRNLVVAFCFGLRDHLRDQAELHRLPGFENTNSNPEHLPHYIVARLYEVFDRWRTEEKLSDQQLWVLDVEARELMEVCGACERIKNTMMSVSWRAFTRQCVVVTLLVVPWTLVDQFGFWTVVLTVLIGYFAAAGEAIARYVEAPFGRSEDHLDLDGICEAIDRSVTDVLMGNGQD